ncbi:hypothetical protein KBC85_03650 [Candidatus Saccharibacteria bacterium]|nr:hypothetical protein [Candidatus Saccharibacteria bacterium]MDQ5953420.1 hypothetical protein [Patescibacteria group bacterium]MDQ5958323.1 hypothetical protein [Patescibacteria group bacterium]
MTEAFGSTPPQPHLRVPQGGEKPNDFKFTLDPKLLDVLTFLLMIDDSTSAETSLADMIRHAIDTYPLDDKPALPLIPGQQPEATIPKHVVALDPMQLEKIAYFTNRYGYSWQEAINIMVKYYVERQLQDPNLQDIVATANAKYLNI